MAELKDLKTNDGQRFIKDLVESQKFLADLIEDVGIRSDQCMADLAKRAGLNPRRFYVDEDNIQSLVSTCLSIMQENVKDFALTLTYHYHTHRAIPETYMGSVFVHDVHRGKDGIHYSVSGQIEKHVDGKITAFDGRSWREVEK
jgi:hypothetical protein